MMKKNIQKAALGVLLSASAVSAFAQQEVDTLYYDKDWKGAQHKAFADYYRVIPKTTDTVSSKPLRDYYITGEIQGEAHYITIDRDDDSKSVFDGEVTEYYKDGKVKAKGSMSKGLKQGEWTLYRENGLVDFHTHYIDGKMNGIVTKFSEDGSLCSQYEYCNGEALCDWHMVSDKDGNCSKVRTASNTPIYESPQQAEKTIRIEGGRSWVYFTNNGITLGTSNWLLDDSGLCYHIPIMIANNSAFPIEFDPTEIRAVMMNRKNLPSELQVYSVDDQMQRLRRKQKMEAALVGIANGMAIASAGYSTSTTTTYHTGFSNGSVYTGASVSTTTSYNALAAYQAQVIASNEMAEYKKTWESEQKETKEGYFKQITIQPGETVNGYVNVEYKRGRKLYLAVFIMGGDYVFPWNIKDRYMIQILHQE